VCVWVLVFGSFGCLSRAGFSGGSEVRADGSRRGVVPVVVVLVLDGRHESDLAVQAPVVEPVDVLRDG
jgi:hypothetical protein